MKQFKAIAGFLAATYIVVAAAVYMTQHRVIFRSSGPSFEPPADLAAETLYLRTPDGETLYAWWLSATDATRTVLFFQGNGRNVSGYAFRVRTFARMGLNALLIDYRGYGKSSGRIASEQDIYMDAETAWQYLVTKKQIAPDRIIIWGRSIGGGVASEMALRHPAAALVLESTFTSLDAVARKKFWFLPTSRLLRFHFRNGDKVRHVDCPMLVIHSVEDDYIPFWHALELYRAAAVPKALIRATGSHLDLFDRDDGLVGALVHQLAHIPGVTTRR